MQPYSSQLIQAICGLTAMWGTLWLLFYLLPIALMEWAVKDCEKRIIVDEQARRRSSIWYL